jgi:hypothetical protein
MALIASEDESGSVGAAVRFGVLMEAAVLAITRGLILGTSPGAREAAAMVDEGVIPTVGGGAC